MSSILFTTGLLATLLLFLFVFYLRLCVRERFFPLKGVAIGKPFFFLRRCVAVVIRAFFTAKTYNKDTCEMRNLGMGREEGVARMW